MKYGKNPRGYVATAPSAESTKKAFGISKKKAQTIRRLMKGEVNPHEIIPYPRVYYYEHPWYYHVMLAIDKVLDAYGVEAIQGEDPDGDTHYFDYINTGDAYSTTILYRPDHNRFYITTWGDVVESLERQGWRFA